MRQHELDQRYKKLARFATIERIRYARREDMNGTQFGVIVNDDHTIWRRIPKDPAEDEQFVKDLCAIAKAEARKQD